MNAKVFNLITEVNEAKFLVQHELFECKCRSNEIACDSKQKWNHNECRCECKELDGWGTCEKGYIWNPSACDFVYNKACKIHKYLDTKKCFCEKHLIVKWVLVCEAELLNTTKNLINDKIAESAKNNCFVYTISSIVISFLLLVVICVTCYFYHTKYQSKQLFHNIKIKLGQTRH